jgi:hypothetical protein
MFGAEGWCRVADRFADHTVGEGGLVGRVRSVVGACAGQAHDGYVAGGVASRART